MHPIFFSKTRLAFYLAAWVPIGVGLAFLLARVGHLPWNHASLAAAGLALFYALVCLSPWYSCQFLPLEPEAMGKLLLNHTTAAAAAAALFIGLSRLMNVPSSQMPLLFGTGLLLYLLAVALHYVLLSFQSSQQAETREQEARVLAREAELKALKAQINPHFLFNSLNSISALATIDGQRARDMCLRLSDFLRSTLSLAEKEMISLEQEVALVRTYLDVERVRFGERLKVEQDLTAACDQCRVPSLILQPLVENAVKHGISRLVEGGRIHISGNCADGILHLQLENDFDPDSKPAPKSGVGLVNVRNRLKTLYQNHASLTIQVRDNRYCVDLELPCDS